MGGPLADRARPVLWPSAAPAAQQSRKSDGTAGSLCGWSRTPVPGHHHCSKYNTSQQKRQHSTAGLVERLEQDASASTPPLQQVTTQHIACSELSSTAQYVCCRQGRQAGCYRKRSRDSLREGPSPASHISHWTVRSALTINLLHRAQAHVMLTDVSHSCTAAQHLPPSLYNVSLPGCDFGCHFKQALVAGLCLGNRGLVGRKAGWVADHHIPGLLGCGVNIS
jgi:hypothetical protein